MTLGMLMQEVRAILVAPLGSGPQRLTRLRRDWMDGAARGALSREEMSTMAGILLLAEQLIEGTPVGLFHDWKALEAHADVATGGIGGGSGDADGGDGGGAAGDGDVRPG